jgi:hypothetical protein
MKDISDKSCRENRNTHFMFSNAPSPPKKNLPVYAIMWKNDAEVGQATDENMVHVHGMLDN